MFFGVLVGLLLKQLNFLQKISKTISYTIYLLLFLLGISVGANKEIVSNLANLGGLAFVIALAGVLGSAVMALLVYEFFFKKDDSINNKDVVS